MLENYVKDLDIDLIVKNGIFFIIGFIIGFILKKSIKLFLFLFIIVTIIIFFFGYQEYLHINNNNMLELTSKFLLILEKSYLYIEPFLKFMDFKKGSLFILGFAFAIKIF